MNRRYVRLLGIALLLALILSGFVVSTASATGCTPNPSAHLRHSGSYLIGSTFNTGRIQNLSSTCSYTVGIAAYEKLSSNIETQVFFSGQAYTINPGQTLILGPIALPRCATQVDLFYGPILYSFAGGVRYGVRLLDAEHLGGTNYCSPPPPPRGNQGCTPGYWKNHTGSWTSTPYRPHLLVSGVFSPVPSALANWTLLQALDGGGGPGTLGAAKILLRAAVAALLNASSSGVDYALTPTQVISQVNAALASNNRDTMLALATRLDGYNNRGCPLN